MSSIFTDSERCRCAGKRDGFLCIMTIIHIFHGGYFDNRGAFLDLYTNYGTVDVHTLQVMHMLHFLAHLRKLYGCYSNSVCLNLGTSTSHKAV